MEQSNADLHALFVEIRDQVKSLNHKIETSERASDTFDGAAGSRRERMMNLRECYRSAADVVSTTSSTLTVKVAPKGAKSVVYGSDLGDILPKEESEAMRRWLSSRTVAGDDFAPTIGPDDAIAEEIYESDSDFEGEMVQALFDEAIRLKDEEHLESAASKLRNCLSLASEEDTQSIKCVTRPEILEALVDTYWMMKSWGHARAMLAEKMSITERQYGTKGAIFMWDTLNLATLMMKDAKYVEAHLQGRRALQGFRRLKEPGRLGYEKSLMLLIELSKIREKKDEEDAYVTLLAGHQAKGLPPKDLDSSINAVTKQRGRSAKADTDDRAIHKVEPPKETKAEPTAERLVKSELIVPQYSSAQQDLIYKLRGTSFIPVTLEEIWCVMIQTEAVRRTHSVELDIVAQFGRDISGKVPQWSTCYDGKGWSCLLTFDASREILVSHLRSEEMAKGAALSAACHRFLPHRMTEIRENGDKISDPISDKVVFVAKDTSAEIMRSQPTLVVGIDFGVSGEFH